jgi:Tol biopolymer transport system component
MREFAVDLRRLARTTELISASPEYPRRRDRHAWIASSVLAVALVASLIAAILYFRSPPPAATDARFELAVPEMPSPYDIALSPDGRNVAYVAASGKGRAALWVRPINSLDARMLPGTEGAGEPFWSADSEFIAFASGTGSEHQLKKVGAHGGAVQTITDLGSAGICCGSWNRDGIIVFSHRGVLHRVSGSGGEAVNISELDRSREEVFHARPQFLPSGRHFLYMAWSGKPENRSIYIGSLDSKIKTRLMTTESNAVYAPPGFILFLKERALMARPFDADRMEFTGQAVPLAKSILLNAQGGIGAFAASDNGTLIYRSEPADKPSRRFLWLDRLGRPGGSIGTNSNVTTLTLSPDGNKVAFAAGEAGVGDIWVYDLHRDLRTRLTTGFSVRPIWSPDGSRLIFGFGTSEGRSLYERSSNGAVPERLLLPNEPGKALALIPLDWSLDGKLLVFAQIPVTGIRDLWVMPLSGGGKPFPYLLTPFDEPQAVFSPDTRWLAYVSGESGAYEVVVQPFPDSSRGKWQISTEGGVCPQWSRDGSEIYYIDSNGRIIAVAVKTDQTFEVGKATTLFETRLGFPALSNTSLPSCPYDVTADGQRFLISEPLGNPSPITVILNWSSGLNR